MGGDDSDMIQRVQARCISSILWSAMSFAVFIGLALVITLILGFVGLYILIYQALHKAQNPQNLEAMVNQAFGLSAQKIAEQSKQILGSEKDAIRIDLDNKQKMLERLVKELKDDVKTRQDEIRLLEQDRTKKFTELVGQLGEHRKLTEELNISTRQLSSVLSNNQQRGEWGERIIEDLLQANGLMEGVHYVRQTQQLTGGLRPDITLLLPNQRNVPVDVKFPYAAIQKMANAATKAEKEAFVKQFSLDLKTKITKVAGYIDPAQQTLDYAILFVPNEMVFSFINQRFPELVDEAIAKRVLIVSPFTFLIVARTVMESYRNFMIGDKLKEVITYVDEFVGEWQKFKDKFSKYGKSLQTLQSDYEDITGTRVRQMERKIEKIEGYRRGSLLEAGTAKPS